MMTLASKTIVSPIGQLKLVAGDAGLIAILWPDDKPGRVRLGAMAEDPNYPLLVDTERQLSA